MNRGNLKLYPISYQVDKKIKDHEQKTLQQQPTPPPKPGQQHYFCTSDGTQALINITND